MSYPHNYPHTYPHKPGYKKTDTSRDAAGNIEYSARRIRDLVLSELYRAGKYGVTSRELSERLGIDYASVQPHTSELSADLTIKDSGYRRIDKLTGKRVIVWVHKAFV